MPTVQTAAPRKRILRSITTAESAYSTSLNDQRLHQFYLQRLAAQRGPTPAELRRQRHEATIKALIARCTPNVCTALPLMGRPLVPTAVVRYQ